jgi:hypothetical protein
MPAANRSGAYQAAAREAAEWIAGHWDPDLTVRAWWALLAESGRAPGLTWPARKPGRYAAHTSLVGEGAREVALARNRRQANTVIAAVVEYARRLMADGPWKPPVKPAGAATGIEGLRSLPG